MVIHPCAHGRNETIELVGIAIGIPSLCLLDTNLSCILLADWWRR
jgi:hypothetical protein